MGGGEKGEHKRGSTKGRAQKGEHKRAICSLALLDIVVLLCGGLPFTNPGYSSSATIYISIFVGMKEGDVVLEIDKAALAY